MASTTVSICVRVASRLHDDEHGNPRSGKAERGSKAKDSAVFVRRPPSAFRPHFAAGIIRAHAIFPEDRMDLPDDEHLTRSMTELGDPEAFFRIGRGRFLAKLVVGVSLLLVGHRGQLSLVGPRARRFRSLAAKLLILLPSVGSPCLAHVPAARALRPRLPDRLVAPAPGRGRFVPLARDRPRPAQGSAPRRQSTIDRGTRRDAGRRRGSPADVPTFSSGTPGLTVARDDGIRAHFGPALTDYDRLAEEVQKRPSRSSGRSSGTRFLAGASIAFGDLESVAQRACGTLGSSSAGPT